MQSIHTLWRLRFTKKKNGSSKERGDMNIIEAVRSGKRFRREGFNWFPFNADHYNSVSKEDILATDWEILDTWNVDTAYRSSGVEL